MTQPSSRHPSLSCSESLRGSPHTHTRRHTHTDTSTQFSTICAILAPQHFKFLGKRAHSLNPCPVLTLILLSSPLVPCCCPGKGHQTPTQTLNVRFYHFSYIPGMGSLKLLNFFSSGMSPLSTSTTLIHFPCIVRLLTFPLSLAY